MKSLTISTILSFYLATCLAMTDTVKLLYNDGFSYKEIDIPLNATEVVLSKDIRTGSQQMPITDVYAAQILSKHEEKAVFCAFHAIRGSEEETFNTNETFAGTYDWPSRKSEDEEESLVIVEAVNAEFVTPLHYTSPPQNVEMVSCYAVDSKGLSNKNIFELCESMIPWHILWRLWIAFPRSAIRQYFNN